MTRDHRKIIRRMFALGAEPKWIQMVFEGRYNVLEIYTAIRSARKKSGAKGIMYAA